MMIALLLVLVICWSGPVYSGGKALADVLARLKAHEVWMLQRTATGYKPAWSPVHSATQADLREARNYIETLYDSKPSSLPGGDIGARMMLRYLSGRIPANTDRRLSFNIRALCVYPRAVSVKWQDRQGKSHEYTVSESEMTIFPLAIKAQMDNWVRTLFEISCGKFSISYDVTRSARVMSKLTRASSGRYWLSPTPAKALLRPNEEVMVCIFWLPKWGDPPPMIGAACYSRPQRAFPHHAISLHTTQRRLLDPNGWVNPDGGLSHELWHYFRTLACMHSFEGFVADGHAKGRADWEKLKAELRVQGLPIPRYAHEEQYAHTFTWSFVEKLRRAHNQ